MQIKYQSSAVFCAVLVGAAALLAACATTGRDRATKTTTSIEAVEADYKQASEQIDATKASLQALMKPGQEDIKGPYRAYAADVRKTEKVAKQLYFHTDQMTTRRDAYFAEWEGAYTNPEIRELSERRRIEMRAVYAQIPEASVGVRGALESYVTDIREIEMYLSNDLTPQGIQAIGPVAERAVKDGQIVKEAIERALIAIDRVKGEMVQGGMNE